MPDVDGIELLRHIRSDAAYKHVPVVSEPRLPGLAAGLSTLVLTAGASQ